MNNMEAIKLIDKYKCVSFDIFDTLIKRNVCKPTDVFYLVEQEYNKNNKKKIRDFCENRINAERKARLVYKSKTEITLSNIYEFLKKKYGKKCNSLMNMEKNIEISICQRNNDKFINEIYKYACDNKVVIITSDMYLPLPTIKKILNKNGFTDYARIYLSSNLKRTKENGKIFDYIVSDLKLEYTDIIHIGDNKLVDYNIPISKRMGAIHYIESQNRLINRIYRKLFIKKHDFDNYDIIKRLCLNNLSKEVSIPYKFGYECFGPLMLGFNKFIYNSAKKDNISKLYFLARDGYVIKECFDSLYNNTNIQTYYTYSSRRSILVPYLWKLKSVHEMISYQKNINPYISPKNLLRRLGMDDYDYSKELDKIGYNYSTKYSLKELMTEEKFANFLESKYDDIINNSLKEYKGLCKYLNSIEFCNKVAVVDVGWYCSTQKALQELFGNDIYGYYIGIKNKSGMHVTNRYGYLYDFKKNLDLSVDMDFYFTFFESVFLGNHGSVKNFNENGKPNLYEYELSNVELNTIRDIQKGAIDFCKKVKEHKLSDYIDIDERKSFDKFNYTMLNPTKKLSKFFGDIKYMNDEIMPIAAPKRFYKYILNPKMFIYDFKNSSWKIGYIKRLFGFTYPNFLKNYFRVKYRKNIQ